MKTVIVKFLSFTITLFQIQLDLASAIPATRHPITSVVPYCFKPSNENGTFEGSVCLVNAITVREITNNGHTVADAVQYLKDYTNAEAAKYHLGNGVCKTEFNNKDTVVSIHCKSDIGKKIKNNIK